MRILLSGFQVKLAIEQIFPETTLGIARQQKIPPYLFFKDCNVKEPQTTNQVNY